MIKIITMVPTILKAMPLQAVNLAPNQRRPVGKFVKLVIKSTELHSGHYELANGWFVFAKHVAVIEEDFIGIATDFIAPFEGLRLSAYICPAGVATIGYGTTAYEDGRLVNIGDTITATEASRLFKNDLVKFSKALEKLPEWSTFNANQKAAILSFAYNVGINAYINSTLRKVIRSNSSEQVIREQFARWNRGAGQVLPGLVKRRTAESEIFFK